MKILLGICICLFFFDCTTLAQKKTEIITQCKQFRYCYEGEPYTKNSLGKVLKSNKDADKSYRRFKRVRNTSLISAGLALGMLGLANESPCESDDCHTRRGIVGLLGAAVALPTFFISRVKFWKSIRKFNESQTNSIGVNPLLLDLKYTGNGVGLVLTF